MSDCPRRLWIGFTSNSVPFGRVVISVNVADEGPRLLFHTFCIETRREFPRYGIKMKQRDNFIVTYHPIGFPRYRHYGNIREGRVTKSWEEGNLAVKIGESGFEFLICAQKSDLELELIPAGKVEEGMDVIKEAFGRVCRQENVEICAWDEINEEK